MLPSPILPNKDDFAPQKRHFEIKIIYKDKTKVTKVKARHLKKQKNVMPLPTPQQEKRCQIMSFALYHQAGTNLRCVMSTPQRVASLPTTPHKNKQKHTFLGL